MMDEYNAAELATNMLTPLEEDTEWSFEATKLVAESYLEAEAKLKSAEQDLDEALEACRIWELSDNHEYTSWRNRAEKSEALIKAVSEIPDKWLAQSRCTESNLLPAETEGMQVGYDWRERNRTRNDCADELQALIKEQE